MRRPVVPHQFNGSVSASGSHASAAARDVIIHNTSPGVKVDIGTLRTLLEENRVLAAQVDDAEQVVGQFERYCDWQDRRASELDSRWQVEHDARVHAELNLRRERYRAVIPKKQHYQVLGAAIGIAALLITAIVLLDRRPVRGGNATPTQGSNAMAAISGSSLVKTTTMPCEPGSTIVQLASFDPNAPVAYLKEKLADLRQTNKSAAVPHTTYRFSLSSPKQLCDDVYSEKQTHYVVWAGPFDSSGQVRQFRHDLGFSAPLKRYGKNYVLRNVPG